MTDLTPVDETTYIPDEMRTFTSAVESDKLRVRVIVEVEAKQLGPDVFEVSETAGMFAARVFKAGEREDGLAPFTRPVPF